MSMAEDLQGCFGGQTRGSEWDENSEELRAPDLVSSNQTQTPLFTMWYRILCLPMPHRNQGTGRVDPENRLVSLLPSLSMSLL